MALRIAVQKETGADETRVAATPDTVKKYVAMGFEVTVESGAGERSCFTDEMYRDAGAAIAKTPGETAKGADIVLRVSAPASGEIQDFPKGCILIAMLAPHKNEKLVKDLASAGVTAMAMELLPRITRAQAMDVLSSQSNLAGYKAVLDAAEHFTRAFPMMMTAAGTIAPARVFVMGAGVAGLQAIATARRLGAVVSATDVRPAAREQVASLGASFVAVEDEEFRQAETAGGYAKEMSAEYRKKQQALIEETIRKQDIVITTALIPGRPAPKLISEAMVKSMKQGSVIVDLAAESGGNCELSQAGKVVKKHGVTIIAHNNFAGRLATDASALYAKNLLNLVALLVKEGKIALNSEDEIIRAITLTGGGKTAEAPAPKAEKEKKVPDAPQETPSKDEAKPKSPAKKAPAKKKASSPKSETRE